MQANPDEYASPRKQPRGVWYTGGLQPDHMKYGFYDLPRAQRKKTRATNLRLAPRNQRVGALRA